MLSMLQPVQSSEPVAPWEYVHGWLCGQRDRMAQDLETAHAALVDRARAAGEDEQIDRLSEPPQPRLHGYGVLPEIVDDKPLTPVEPRRTLYSLEGLSTSFAGAFRDASVLAARVPAEPDLPLVPWVDEFLRLRERMRNLEDHLDYHAKWQIEVVAYRRWFGERNRIIDQVRRMRELEQQQGPSDEIETLRSEILRRMSPFRVTEGLRMTRGADGTRQLLLTVSTDIEDETFLDKTGRAVETAYNGSAAARDRGFVLAVDWKRIPAETLYPEGRPARAEEIDVARHTKRFPAGDLVLSTGAKSTHAWTGRSVLLGPGNIEGRVLAHELSHLLGFDDAYLRGYEGDPQGEFGALLVEWVGLKDDLMGNPSGGAVTPAMIDRLIAAYGDAAGDRPGSD